MAIRILPDSIKIGPYTLSETSTGFRFDGGVRTFGNETHNYFGGTVAGYVSGGSPPTGHPGSGPTGFVNTIQKFPFASNSNSTDVGDLSQARLATSGQSSSTHGYNSGGYAPPSSLNRIDKYPFATNANATTVGVLGSGSEGWVGAAGHSSKPNGFGFHSGGNNAFLYSPSGNIYNNILRFPFSADTNATDLADLTVFTHTTAGHSSLTHGYTSGGAYASGTNAIFRNVIDRFSFVNTANAVDVGDLTLPRRGVSGTSSSSHGYTAGGGAPPGVLFSNGTVNTTIDRFPFAATATASDVGDLLAATTHTSGQSSTSDGYSSGGFTTTGINVIQKFPFSTNSNATDVGDLLAATDLTAGQQI